MSMHEDGSFEEVTLKLLCKRICFATFCRLLSHFNNKIREKSNMSLESLFKTTLCLCQRNEQLSFWEIELCCVSFALTTFTRTSRSELLMRKTGWYLFKINTRIKTHHGKSFHIFMLTNPKTPPSFNCRSKFPTKRGKKKQTSSLTFSLYQNKIQQNKLCSGKSKQQGLISVQVELISAMVDDAFLSTSKWICLWWDQGF